MSGPLAYPDLPQWIWRGFFWLGITLMAISVVLFAVSYFSSKSWLNKSVGGVRVSYKPWVLVLYTILVLSAASLFLSLKTNIIASQAITAITGGNNYPRIEVDIDNRDDKTGAFPVVLVNSGESYIYDVWFWIHRASTGGKSSLPAYWQDDEPRPIIPVVPPGRHIVREPLPPGRWRIEIDARNGHLTEWINIIEYQGNWIQIVDQIHNGTNETVYKSDRPEGY